MPGAGGPAWLLREVGREGLLREEESEGVLREDGRDWLLMEEGMEELLGEERSEGLLREPCRQELPSADWMQGLLRELCIGEHSPVGTKRKPKVKKQRTRTCHDNPRTHTNAPSPPLLSLARGGGVEGEGRWGLSARR